MLFASGSIKPFFLQLVTIGFLIDSVPKQPSHQLEFFFANSDFKLNHASGASSKCSDTFCVTVEDLMALLWPGLFSRQEGQIVKE